MEVGNKITQWFVILSAGEKSPTDSGNGSRVMDVLQGRDKAFECATPA